jgi:hypothetical protein
VTPQEAIAVNSIPSRDHWQPPAAAAKATEVNLLVHDSGEVELLQDGAKLATVKAIRIEDGVLKVTDEDGAVHVFGPAGPGAPPRLTPAPKPPSSFPGVTQAVADYFGVEDEAPASC